MLPFDLCGAARLRSALYAWLRANVPRVARFCVTPAASRNTVAGGAVLASRVRRLAAAWANKLLFLPLRRIGWTAVPHTTRRAFCLLLCRVCRAFLQRGGGGGGRLLPTWHYIPPLAHATLKLLPAPLALRTRAGGRQGRYHGLGRWVQQRLRSAQHPAATAPRLYALQRSRAPRVAVPPSGKFLPCCRCYLFAVYVLSRCTVVSLSNSCNLTKPHASVPLLCLLAFPALFVASFLRACFAHRRALTYRFTRRHASALLLMRSTYGGCLLVPSTLASCNGRGWNADTGRGRPLWLLLAAPGGRIPPFPTLHFVDGVAYISPSPALNTAWLA